MFAKPRVMRGFVLFTVGALKSGDKLEFLIRDRIEGGISRYSCFGIPFAKLRLQEKPVDVAVI